MVDEEFDEEVMVALSIRPIVHTPKEQRDIIARIECGFLTSKAFFLNLDSTT